MNINDQSEANTNEAQEVAMEQPQPQPQRQRHIRPKVRNRRNRTSNTTTTAANSNKNAFVSVKKENQVGGAMDVDVDVDVDALMAETLKKMASASVTSTSVLPITTGSGGGGSGMSHTKRDSTSIITTAMEMDIGSTNHHHHQTSSNHSKKPKGILKNSKSKPNTSSSFKSSKTKTMTMTKSTGVVTNQSIRSSTIINNYEQHEKSLAEELGFPKGYEYGSGSDEYYLNSGGGESKPTVKPFVKDQVFERPLASIKTGMMTGTSIYNPTSVEGHASSTYVIPTPSPTSGEDMEDQDENDGDDAPPKIIKSVAELVAYAEEVKAEAASTEKNTKNMNVDGNSDENSGGAKESSSSSTTTGTGTDTTQIAPDHSTIEANMEFSCMAPDDYDAIEKEAKLMGLTVDEYLAKLDQDENDDIDNDNNDMDEGEDGIHNKSVKNDYYGGNPNHGNAAGNGAADSSGSCSRSCEEDNDFLDFFGSGLDEEDFEPSPPPRPFMVLWNAISMWITPDAIAILRKYKQELFVNNRGDDHGGSGESNAVVKPMMGDSGDASSDAGAGTEGDIVNDIHASRCAGLMAMLRRNIPKSLNDLGYRADDGYTRRTAENRLGEFIQCFDYSEPMVKLKSDMWRALTVVLLDIILPKYDLAYEGQFGIMMGVNDDNSNIGDGDVSGAGSGEEDEGDDKDGQNESDDTDGTRMYPTVLETVGIMKEEYTYLVTRAIPTLDMGS